jgi:hypothetical protein
MALAYLLGKPTAKILKVNLNIPLILVLSVIPDIDLLLMPSMHRGPTHSVIMAAIVFIPAFAFYGRKAVPYFIALVSHSLIGDFFIGGQIMLFWPLTNAEFGLHELGSFYINIRDPVNVVLELTLFALALIVLLKTKDICKFFQNKKTNLILIIPIFTVLLPAVISYPLTVPLALIPTHLFLLILFSISVLIALAGILGKKWH